MGFEKAITVTTAAEVGEVWLGVDEVFGPAVGGELEGVTERSNASLMELLVPITGFCWHVSFRARTSMKGYII